MRTGPGELECGYTLLRFHSAMDRIFRSQEVHGRIQDEDHLYILLFLAAGEESFQVAVESRAGDCIPSAKCCNEVGPFIKIINSI